MARSLTSTNESVTRMTSAMPSAPSSSIDSRCFTASDLGHDVADDDAVLAHVDLLVPPGRQVLTHVVGADRQLAVAPVDHHGQLHRLGPAVIGQGVEGG